MSPKSQENFYTRDNEKKKLSRFHKGVATTAAGIIGLTAMAGCSSDADTERTPSPNPSVSESHQPVGPESNTIEGLMDLESLRIPSDLPAEEFVDAIYELEDAWMMAMAREEHLPSLKERRYGYGSGRLDEFLDDIVEENAEYFEDIILPEGWSSDPNLIKFHNAMTSLNRDRVSSNLGNYTREEPLVSVYSEPQEFVEILSIEDVQDPIMVSSIDSDIFDGLEDGSIRMFDINIKRSSINAEGGDESSVHKNIYALDVSGDTAKVVFVGR